MPKIYRPNAASITILAIAAISVSAAHWRVLDDGLDFARFRSPHHINDSSAFINVLRINTQKYDLRLFNASRPDQGAPMRARRWAQNEGLAAAINAAMYQADYLKSVSFMRTSDHVNNPRISKDKTILVFEPLASGIPRARIVDLDCDNFEEIRNQYGSAVQSIRMLSCDGRNVWQQSDKRHSIAAVGTDKDGRVLFIQSTAAHTVHDFINVLTELPISIDRAMYMEGGSPSQLYISAPRDTMEFIGDFSSGGRNFTAPDLPNVLGIKKR